MIKFLLIKTSTAPHGFTWHRLFLHTKICSAWGLVQTNMGHSSPGVAKFYWCLLFITNLLFLIYSLTSYCIFFFSIFIHFFFLSSVASVFLIGYCRDGMVSMFKKIERSVTRSGNTSTGHLQSKHSKWCL